MIRTFVLLELLLLFSCNSKTTKEEVQNHETSEDELVYPEPKITGDRYFDFDELLHYRTDFEESRIRELSENEHKSELDSLKSGVLLGSIPNSLTDVTFIKNLSAFGYRKYQINKEKFAEINSIFTEKKHAEVVAYACDYVYRDILIFKKKSKIVGIAKICFECGGSRIVGTKANTDEFGQSGDLERLKKLLSGE